MIVPTRLFVGSADIPGARSVPIRNWDCIADILVGRGRLANSMQTPILKVTPFSRVTV
jgi:hypothetical protein